MNERIVKLPFGKTIFQSLEGHSVTKDAKYLIDFVLNNNENRDNKVLELGSGTGIIPIMLAHYRPTWQFLGIEIQSKLIDIARSNLKLIKQKIEFYQADIKSYRNSRQDWDIIVSNPPYYIRESSRISPNREKAIARHEILCKMKDILTSIQFHLAADGKAYLIYPLFRQTELKKLLPEFNLTFNKVKYPDSKRFMIEICRCK